MKIKPLQSFKLHGTDVALEKGVEYDAKWAVNQPQWRDRRKIFVNGVLLEAGDYVITLPDVPPDIRALKSLLRSWHRSVEVGQISGEDSETAWVTVDDYRVETLKRQTEQMLEQL